ncbi:MAG TPA: DinB family protein [Candidatus Acidoferrales bacterium]|nr:DinB family protein [Candidatus Acidoferrales bacterium]
MRRAAGFAAVALGLLMSGATAMAQQTTPKKPAGPPTISSVMQTQLGIVEYELVPAAKAMPEDKYNFAPAESIGNYKGVRTFAQEVKHIATANFAFYSAILGQAPPAGVTANEMLNGPDDIQTKDQIVKYLQDSLALGHKAMASLTAENAVTPLPKPPIPFLNTRLSLASFSCTHAFDHYGQMVEYLRMNGIVPPASQGQPPANPSTGK